MAPRLALFALALVLLGSSAFPQSDLLVVNSDTGTVSRHSHSTGAWLEDWITGLDDPQALLLGPDGNVYVASAGTNDVRRYDGVTGAAKGIFVTAGSGGLNHPTALAFEASGDLLVTSRNTSQLLRYDGTDGSFVDVVEGPGLLLFPSDLVLDAAGDIYLSDELSSQITRVDVATGVIFLFVMNGSGGLAIGGGLTWGPGGDLYVSSKDSDEIKRYDGATGAYLGDFVIAGDGGLDAPQGLHFGPDDGHLYVASSGTDQIKRYEGATGAFLGDFVGSDLGGVRQFGWRTPVTAPPLDLLVVNIVGNKVTRHDGVSGAFVSDYITGLDDPQAVAAGPDGNLYVANAGTDEILEFNGQTGASLGVFAGGGLLHYPSALAFDDNGDLLVVSRNNSSVLLYDGADGSFLDLASSGFLLLPSDLVLDAVGDRYLGDTFSSQIVRIDAVTGADSVFVTGGSGGLNVAPGVTFGPGGNLYVSSQDNDRVIRYDGLDGSPLGDFVTDGDGGLDMPRGLRFGPDDGLLYVVSAGTDEIKRYDGATGTFVDTFVASGLSGARQIGWRPNNQVPTASAGADFATDEEVPVSLDGTGSNDLDDADVLTYFWQQTGGPGVTLDDPTSVEPGLVAPLVGAGGAQLVFELTVDDGKESSAPDEVVVTVENVNSQPFANAGPDANAILGALAQLDGSGSFDPDGESLTYEWTQTLGTAVSLSDPAAEQPTFTAPAVEGTLGFQLRVWDGIEWSVPDAVAVTVQVFNTPPDVSAAVASETELEPNDGSVRTLRIEDVIDAESPSEHIEITILSITQDEDSSASHVPGQVHADGQLAVEFYPGGTSPGRFLLRAEADPLGNGRVYEVIFRATDPQGASSIGSVEVCVPATSGAGCVDDGQLFESTLAGQLGGMPSANAGAGQQVQEGSLVQLDGSASFDAEMGFLGYHWSQLSGPNVTLDLGDPIRPTFSAPAVTSNTELVFELWVETTSYPNPTWTYASLPDPVSVTVQQVNTPPDVSGVFAYKPQLWPPGGAMKTVQVKGVTDAESPLPSDLKIAILSITQDEPVGPSPDGACPNSFINAFRGKLLLRAEREDAGSGRIYEIGFRVWDPDGGSTTGSVQVCVPIVEKGVCIDDGQLFDSALEALDENWKAGPDQDVIEGSLVQLEAVDGPGNPGQVWLQVQGPPVALDTSDPLNPTFVAPPTALDLELVFVLLAWDGISSETIVTVYDSQFDCNENGTPDATDIASGASLDLDADGTPDECQPLSADAATLPIAAGGTIGLALDAGPSHAGELFVLLGSITGTTPGFPIDGLVLPLNFDDYFLITLGGTGLPQPGVGALDPTGKAASSLFAPAGLISPNLAGLVVYHAYAAVNLGGSVTLTSNAISTTLVP